MTDSAPPPVPAPQPASSPAPVSAPAEKWNVLSIIGFVIVFFGFSVISIILGFIGLNQIKKTGERGRGLALWAIILGFLSIVIGIIVWIAGRRDDRGEPERHGPVSQHTTKSPSGLNTSSGGDFRHVEGRSAQCTNSAARVGATTSGIVSRTARPAGSSMATIADASSTAAPTTTAGCAPTA